VDSVNPCLKPSSVGKFVCPIRGDTVQWELKDVFNPAVIVKDGKIYMIYRAEDTVGIHNGTSRLGLAISEDGLHFERQPEPVFYPDNDSMKIYEWEGGCEDPRVVETENGKYIMTYTSYDGKVARLCLASSDDLITWEKHGLVLGYGKFKDQWSKSGAIISKQKGEKIIAHRINGKYWMYWGDKNMHAATSEDLISWVPILNKDGSLKVVFGPRKGSWDSDLVEPGPPPLLTEFGILFIYNSRNVQAVGTKDLPEHTYAAGQILMDKNDPLKVISRTENYFFKPEKDYEITGQVGNVCFLEGLVPFQNKWFLYYGTADSKIAVAIYDPV
jgi:predicted GH43/DUF377 family glycosyl hydrolase